MAGVGLNATDTIISVPRHPDRGSKVEVGFGERVAWRTSGKRGHCMPAWGLRTRYVGKLGDDPAAALHRQEFARAGVDAQIITAPECASHQSFILVDPSGERTVIRRQDEESAASAC